MFIWICAINPGLSRRPGRAWIWRRRPAPMIICGLVHVRRATKRPQTATGWLRLWPRRPGISLWRKYFHYIKWFCWIYSWAGSETASIYGVCIELKQRCVFGGTWEVTEGTGHDNSYLTAKINQSGLREMDNKCVPHTPHLLTSAALWTVNIQRSTRSVYSPPSAEREDANLKLRCCHLVNLTSRSPDQNCCRSEVAVWPPAYQSRVYLKSMCSNGRQQTAGPQAMERFAGKSHLGIQIRQVHLAARRC